MSLIVSGFPGIGKSTLYNRCPAGVKILDSDSSKFDKTNFPTNYLDYVEQMFPTHNLIQLVSSHKDVRNGLVARSLPFTLVYPAKECKEEYMQRFRARKSPPPFIQLLDKNWDTWIEECQNQLGCTRRELGPGEYLADALGF